MGKVGCDIWEKWVRWAKKQIPVYTVRVDAHRGAVPRRDAIARGAGDLIPAQLDTATVGDDIRAGAREGDGILFSVELAAIDLDARPRGADDEVATEEDARGGAHPDAGLRAAQGGALAIVGARFVALDVEVRLGRLRGDGLVVASKGLPRCGCIVQGTEGLGDARVAAARDPTRVHCQLAHLGKGDSVWVAHLVPRAAERDALEMRAAACAQKHVLRRADDRAAARRALGRALRLAALAPRGANGGGVARGGRVLALGRAVDAE